MEWTDEAIILDTKKLGESSIVVNLMTPEHGRHAGLVRGASKKRDAGIFQTGNIVRAHWRGRLEEQLGRFNCELTKANAANFLREPLKLAALSSACALTQSFLPEREAHRAIFEGLKFFISSLNEDHIWPMIYLRLELGMLKELGFGLDLSSCAATGSKRDLIYLSPKSGRAISKKAGTPYHNKLFKLPKVLIDPSIHPSNSEIFYGLKITGYFFKRNVLGKSSQDIPNARKRLIERFKFEIEK